MTSAIFSQTIVEHKSHNYSEDAAPTEANDVEQKQSFSGSTVPLEQLALARSGDKGDTCNIGARIRFSVCTTKFAGVVARNGVHFDHLCKYLTVDVVRDYFAHYIEEGGNVRRYLLPGIHGMNFVLTKSLGGGGIASLRVDPQVSYASESQHASCCRVKRMHRCCSSWRYQCPISSLVNSVIVGGDGCWQ